MGGGSEGVWGRLFGKLEMDLDPHSWEQKLAELRLPGRNPTDNDASKGQQPPSFSPWERLLVNIQDKTAIH